MRQVAGRQPQTKRNSYEQHMVWFAVFLLSVLVIATMAVLGNALHTYAHRSDCVISLESGAEAMNSPVQVQNAEMQVKDDDITWSTDTQVELFQTSYRNAAGEVTVQSGNTDRVVAPGTDGKYTFTLKNTGSRQMDYKVWVEAEVTSSLSDFPLEARMTGSHGWMLGGDDTWAETQNLNGVSESASLTAGKSTEYTIYWQWPFERGADETDVNMANLSVSQDVSCRIRIYTLAEESISSGSGGHGGGHRVTDGIQNAVDWAASNVFSPKTGDDANIWWWIIWIILAAAGITLCLYVRYRRREQDEDEMEEDTDKK